MTASERIRAARERQEPIGAIDKLGYLYCANCVDVSQPFYHYVWADQCAHTDEPCENCHHPLTSVLEPPCSDPRPDPRSHPQFWTE